MNENKRKYQDYLEANEELEYEIKEIHKTNNNLKQSILKQISDNDNIQSEVRIQSTQRVCYYLLLK